MVGRLFLWKTSPLPNRLIFFIPVFGSPSPGANSRQRRSGHRRRRTGRTGEHLDRESGSVSEHGRPALPFISRVPDGCLGLEPNHRE